MAAASVLTEATSSLRAIPLADVLAAAELQTRMDRKYVVPLDRLGELLHRTSDRLRVLEIGHRRVFRYESVYFDTPALDAYRQHAHGRRRRVKVRTRAYLDTGECVLEFKRTGPRGETVKERFPHPLAARHDLDPRARELARQRVGHLICTARLRPVLTTTYHRVTLVDPALGARLTCDVDLSFDGTGRRHGPLEHLVVLESKTGGSESPADLLLHRLGARPVSLSKYCIGMAVLDPALPANRWNRELRTHFGWAPRR
jgi:hypothetical protein